MMQMLNMQINCWFGGVGVGWMNYFAFLIIAVFISGLMVGRTPEFLGHKVEAREMKIATMVVLMHPFLILVGTGISSAIAAANPEIGWLNNPSFHGLSEMLYEYTSSAANNGSGFEGLADNTPFWNIIHRYRADHGTLFPDRGTGSHRRPARLEEIHSRKRRHAEDRHGHFLADDLRRYRHRGRSFVLPGTGSGPDR